MMKYNEWKLLQESVSSFSLGVKANPIVGKPFGSQGIQEGGFNFGGGDEDDEEEEDDDDVEGDDEEGDDLSDDQLDGDIFGASKEEGGPTKSFPPDDSDDMAGGDDMNFDDDQFDLAGLGGDSPMGSVAGKEAPSDMGDDLGLGGDDMGDLGGLGAEMGDDMGLGGDDMGMGDDLGLGGDDMGDLGGLGAEMGDDMGGEGEPCPDCNPDGAGEPDPECQSCHGSGFLDDMGGEGEIGGDEMAPSMDFLNKMASYQKKYMNANPAMPQQQMPVPQAQAPVAPVPQMQQQQQQQMQPRQPMFSKKYMNKDRKYCGPCRENVGTYQETQEDFFANLAANAKGEARKKWSSGIKEDALLQAVDPNYNKDSGSQAGQVGFAPQGRVGSIGGGYTQQDMQDLPVLGESKKYPTLDQYAKAKAKKTKKN